MGKNTMTDSAPAMALTRVFRAPKDLVYKMWTEPEHLKEWWGPHQFTTPECMMDVRAGGAMRITMRWPSGELEPAEGRFDEVIPGEKLVFTLKVPDKKTNVPMFEVRTTVLFGSAGTNTKLTITVHVLMSTPAAEESLKGMSIGWTQTLERLENVLPGSDQEREIVVTRVFNASREQVFAALTRPEHLKNWWAPKNFTTPYCTVDLRVGGKIHYCMKSADGFEAWGIGVFKEIWEPGRIVYTDSFADKEGNPVLPVVYGLSAEHPAESEVTMTLTTAGGGTRLTLRHSIAAHVKERGDTKAGWNEMLDRLETLLGSQQ